MRLLIQGAEIEKEMEAKAEMEAEVEEEIGAELVVEAEDSIIIKAASHHTAYTQHSVLIIFDCN